MYPGENMDIYEKFKQKPEIYNDLSLEDKYTIKDLLLKDNSLTAKEKQDIIVSAILFIIKTKNNLPSDLISLIYTKEIYLEIASSSFIAYQLLYETKHNFKEEERELFFQKYEREYIYNDDYPIVYAINSSIVLLNTLKRNQMAIYSLSFFGKKAYSNEVVDYIIKNYLSLIKYSSSKEILYSFPKVIYALLECGDIDILFNLNEEKLTEDMAKYIVANKDKYNLEKLVQELDTDKKIINSNLMFILVNISLDNIKYFTSIPSDFLASYLLEQGYSYREEDSLSLLKNDLLLNNLIQKGNLDIIFENDIVLTDNQINLLETRMKTNNYNLKVLTNINLINDLEFSNFLINYYHLETNLDQLNKNKLVSNMGIDINKLNNIFSDQEIQIIIREIINNNYYLDLESVFKIVTPSFYHDLYCQLANLENKINKNFNFYTFIKITEYFQNNLDLLESLSKNKIDSDILNNLSLVINHNRNVSYQELSNYQENYYNFINNSSLTNKDKIYAYLVNASDKKVSNFLTKIGDIPRLTWLQLEFPNNSYEYNLLQSYLNILDIIDKVDKGIITDLDSLKDFKISSRFDIKVMQENILRLYALVYYKLNLDFDKLQEEGKIKTINGNRVLDLTGMDFCFFIHDDEFNSQYDFTNIENGSETKECNYICTSIITKYKFYRLDGRGIIYGFTNPNSLLAFGNLDIYIVQTKAPLISANNHFVNPYEVCYSIDKVGFVDNEFDFLRVDDENKPLKSSFVFSKKLDKKINTDSIVLTINETLHEQSIQEEFLKLRDTIKNLNYHDLYKLIFLSCKYNLEADYIEILLNRIKEMSNKERLVLLDAVNKFIPNIKEKMGMEDDKRK